jgi:hypothetical protein
MGRNSFDFKGLIAWNCLDKKNRNLNNMRHFKKALRNNKKSLEQISFIKGTTTNNNKDVQNFIYY